MPELTEKDAMEMTYDFYHRERGFSSNKLFKFLLILFRMGIHKLVQYAYDNGASDERADR